MGDELALQMLDVSHSFGNVLALRHVDFEVRAGEVHALVGENGAGKSTLMGVAAGSLQPLAGNVRIGGQILDAATPKRSRDLGLRIVRQHPALLPDLSVAENLALGVEPSQRVLRRDINEWTRNLMTRWRMSIDPRRKVSDVPLPQRFALEITKATVERPKVLIVDEPTEHLASAEIDILYDLIDDLRASGTGVVYISHRIPEVQRFASRLTVLRDGRTQGTWETASLTEREIVAVALGRSISSAFPDKSPGVGEVVLAVESLSGRGFRDVSFSLSRGEVLGLAGIEGSGQRGVITALAGGGPSTGTVRAQGATVRPGSVGSARKAGIEFVPEDRHSSGLFMPLSVAENVTASTTNRHSRFGVLKRVSIQRTAGQAVTDYGIKAESIDAPIASLSGGNQQKALIARATLGQPRVLLADEPTQGVDAGARVQIYDAIRDLCSDGSSAVVLSSDAVELAGLCDRVLVFSRGRVIEELAGDAVTAHNVTEASLTSTVLRGEQRDSRRGWLHGSAGWAPLVTVLLAILILGLVAAAKNEYYLSGLNMTNLLTLFAPLAFVAMGQLCALILGGIDLSVGPIMGLTVVLCSFLLPLQPTASLVVVAVACAVVVAILVGGLNGLLISKLGLSPVVATLATYMGALGVAQMLRPDPGGVFPQQFGDHIGVTVGIVPVAAVIAVCLAIGLEIALRCTGWGARLRASGSNPDAAAWLGIKVSRVRLVGYVMGAGLACLGGVLLAAQSGIGDASAGTSFTFASITAVVLGGASIYGGRGSFLGALLGAALVAQINNVTVFLGLESAWQYWLLAILTLAAAGVYSRLEQVSA